MTPKHIRYWVLTLVALGWPIPVSCLALGLWPVLAEEERPHRVLRGHEEPVVALAFAPNGKLLATAGYDKTVRLWDLDSGKGRVFRRSDKPVLQLAFTPDGKTLASANEEQIDFCELATGKERASYKGGSLLAVSPDGNIVISEGPEFTIVGREIKSGKETVIFRGHTDSIRQALFLRDGKALVTASRDGTVRLWDATSGKLHAMLPTLGLIYGMAVSPDEKTIALAGGHREVSLFDIASRKERFSFTYDSRLYSVSFSPEGKEIAVGTDSAVLLLDATTGKLLRVLELAPPGPVFVVKYSPDGKTIAALNSDHSIWLWSEIKMREKGKKSSRSK